MDCEKFDTHLMDALFDELDEVTCAAMKRHSESCARCSSLESGMRATLEVGVLPLEEPSGDLEDRILEAAYAAQRGEPWHRRLLRTLSWAGSHAMRPQLAMAALLVLVLGSSVLLLRARPGTVGVTPVKVAERSQQGEVEAAPVHEPGDPEGDDPAPAAAAADLPVPASLPSAALARADEGEAAEPEDKAKKDGDADPPAGDGAAGDGAYEQAMAAYRAGRIAEAQDGFRKVQQGGGANAPTAGLFLARSARQQGGCGAAVPLYAEVRSRYPGSGAAADATFELADCHRQLGQADQARAMFLALRSNDQYRDRANHELSLEGQAGASGPALAQKSRRAAAAKPSGPASPSEVDDATPGTTAGNAQAAPRPAAPPPAAPPPANAQSY